MSYTPQAWSDGPTGGTPVSAARLNYMEAGIAASGGSSFTADPVGDALIVTVTSNWGVDPGGSPYYDPAGAVAADAAIASLDSTGAFVLTKPS